MELSTSHAVIIAIVTVTIIISSIAIVIAVKIQKKQKQRYNELKNLINENKEMTFSYKDHLTSEEIMSIDSDIDVNELMRSLYATYLMFESKNKNLDTNLDDVLTGYLKEFYINKIKSYRTNGYKDINDSIELIGYSISEFNKNNLKFKIDLSCFNYKMIGDKIVSGSNLYRVHQICIVTYDKVDGKWLISAYDKIYEKKME